MNFKAYAKTDETPLRTRGLSRHVTVALAACALTVAASSCGDDDDDGFVAPEDQRLESGYVISATTPSGSLLVDYFAELPEGAADLSEGTDFQQFFPVDLHEHALYNALPDGSAGFARLMVNGNGEIVVDASASTSDATSFQIAVRDEDTGVFHDRGTPDRLTLFNPTTMAIEGTIDMSDAFVPVGTTPRYQTLYFRGDEVFAPIRGNDGTTYDSLIVHVANVATGSYARTLIVDDGEINPFNDFGQNDLAEDGTLYISDQGSALAANPSNIRRITPGADDFDPDYEFEPASVLNPDNPLLPIHRGFRYIGDGKGIALVAFETPPAAIAVVQEAGGAQNLTPEQIQEILGILFTAPSGRWCVLDMEAQTVTPIESLPIQSVYATTVVSAEGDDLLIPITTDDVNAVYRYDVGADSAEKAFGIVGGGVVTGVYNLANDHE